VIIATSWRQASGSLSRGYLSNTVVFAGSLLRLAPLVMARRMLPPHQCPEKTCAAI